ncbi:pentatricopeptide repeat-containing protein At1g74600, chloroplastic [Ziziphus jujuba]|uniref:Pentatricopeptide repeat-containing protein At1g74600, chloroplastic n=1 Tax=Ziziphus jujuba TaxID=326968 RepID=A0ABM3IJR3_ZIZJJ|nr:pentatricopeptide repeat-containing protein At1g74600, chloroplastic [Ziziphus jujuba]
MKSLFNHKYHTKFALLNLKFASSLSIIDDPPIFLGKYGRGSSPFDPIQFFSEYAKSRLCTITNTKVLHTHLLRTAVLQSNIFVANSLLDWYCKSAAMVDALKLFDLIPHPNIFSWNIMISGYNQNALFLNSWGIYCRMHSSGFEPSDITYGSVLSACTALRAPMFGKQVYSLAMKNGFFSNGFVRAGMIDLFAKTCSFVDALRVFHDVSCQNVVCWNAIISGAVKNEENWIALDIFRQMCSRKLVPNSYTFSSVLTACAAIEDIETGKGVQAWVIKCNAEDVFVGTALVDLYAKCRKMDEAVKKFSQMPIRNVVSWTAIISGFVKKDDSISAVKFFRDMRKTGEEVNNYTLTSVIAACTQPTMIEESTQIHCLILKTGFYLDAAVGAALINMYSKVGAADVSERVFQEMENLQNMGTWAAMASSYAQNQASGRATELFQKMLQESLKPDEFCTSSVLSIIGCLDFGRQIHCYALKSALGFYCSVGCSLSTMYSKCGSLEESYKVFLEIPAKDNVSWASMIAGFAEHGFADQALELFRDMLSDGVMPDNMTLNAGLTACAVLPSLKTGKEIHGYALRAGLGNDRVVGGALITMYSKCSALKLARSVFDVLPEKDQVAWSSLASGYAQNGYIEEAVLLFHHMLMADLAIDSFIVSSILGSIALLNKTSIGTQLHAHIIKMGLDSDVSVGSSLVTMFSKSGSIEDCCKVFDQIEEPDLIGWTAMIVSYAKNGRGAEALRVYEIMKKEGIKPDSVTFVAVLSACSHSGLVEEAHFHLHSMAKDYGIEPGYRHYACMVDLLGRAGRLEEAERFINDMPIEPDSLVWGTLLAACKVHGDIELGKRAAAKVMELEPYDAGAYISMSNICADVGQWEEVLKIRSQMKGIGVMKEPGWSFL